MRKRTVSGMASRLRALFHGLLTAGGGGLLGMPCGAEPVMMPVYMRDYPLSRQVKTELPDAKRVLAQACSEVCGTGVTECDLGFQGKETLFATCAQTVEKVNVPPEGMDCPPDMARGKDCRLLRSATGDEIVAEWHVEKALPPADNQVLCKKICASDATFCSLHDGEKAIATVSCERMERSFSGAGRRPPGLCPSEGASLPGDAGAHLAGAAELEAASVTAFRVLGRELVRLHAPKRLVRGASRAAREEIRHAREMRALARRRGTLAGAPKIEPRPLRDLESLAIDNAVEGCVRETYGALIATWQSKAAQDRHVRDTMSRIAEDETRHAALSWEIAAWADLRLDRASRARVRSAVQTALLALERDIERQPPSPFAAELGLPTSEQARTLARGLTSRLFATFAPAAEGLAS
ncbi:MAG: ferritin-like domain-containing protein [Polyangiaceae bacterium]